MKNVALLIILLALGSSTTTLADELDAALGDEPPKKFDMEVAVLGGLQFGGKYDYRGGRAEYQVGPTVGGIFSWYVRGNGRLQLSYHYQFTELTLTPSTVTEPTVDTRAGIGYIQFGGEADFPMNARPIPFVGMTMGIMHLHSDIPDSGSDWFFAFGIHGGLKIPINKSFGFRAHLKMLIDIPSGLSSTMCVGGHGCTVNIYVDPVMQGQLGAGLYYSF